MNPFLSSLLFLGLIPLSAIAQTKGTDLLARWRFNGEGPAALDEVSGTEDPIQDRFERVPGVSGKALLFDGFTTAIVRPASKAPHMKEAFTIQAWVALGAYPWNVCPVLCRRVDRKKGFSFDIGPRGRVILGVRAGGKWLECASKDFAIPLRKWMHVAGTFDPEKGLALYVNGRPAGRLEKAGKPLFAPGADLILGTNPHPVKPSNIHRQQGTLPSFFCLDGILDELEIRGRALEPGEILAAFRAVRPAAPPDLPIRRMPAGPPGPGRFGAYYTKLKYYKQWDDLWPVAEHPDVVVRFDTTSARVVFWRGTRYSPAWVTGTGLWMGDQSVEAWGVGKEDKEGCFEHMQDRHCRQSHVRILENTPARVLVHWRYAPVSVYEHLWRVHPKTGWACWVDEYYYIYPDAVGVRKVSWKKGTLGRPRQFQESLPFCNPGQVPSDVVEEEFATIANMEGRTLTLRFTENPRKKTKDEIPPRPNIQKYNFRGPMDPFIVFEPGDRMQYIGDRNIRGFHRPWGCNHWPVGQARCDGRTAQAADRPTHFLGFPISYPPIHTKGDRRWWNGLYGMTDLSMADLVALARSWAKAPALTVKTEGFRSLGYDMSQRAYVLERTGPAGKGKLVCGLAASQKSPLFDPAFLVRNWGDARARVSLEGGPSAAEKDFRQGILHRMEGADLVLWIRYRGTKPVELTLK